MELERAGTGATVPLDVLGGIAFAGFVGIACMRVGAHAVNAATDNAWVAMISWEGVWFVAAMLCRSLLPSGIVHDISWRSTLEGLKLDWPELLFATYTFGVVAAWLGAIHFTVAPVAFALAVGAAEECFFRVLVLGWLVTRVSTPAALTISAVVFGLAHLHELSLLGVLSIVPQTAGGFVLGAAYLRTRNPLGPIIAHAYWDLPYFLGFGLATSGGSTAGGMPSVASLLPWMCFAVYGLWLVRHGIPAAGRVDPVGCSCRSCHQHPHASSHQHQHHAHVAPAPAHAW